jgi:hypothetical protein
MVRQQVKTERVKYPGLLKPLPTPDAAWQMVTMDFVEGLPTSGSANNIMVVMDKFTCLAHFIPPHHPFIAVKVATNPQAMCSSCKTSPRSRFLTEIPFLRVVSGRSFSLMGNELRMTFAYHPQTSQ